MTMLLLPCLLLLGSGISPAWAMKAVSNDICFEACNLCLRPAYFKDTDPAAPKFARQCQSRLRIDSLYLCTKLYCTPGEVEGGLASWNQTCQIWGNTTLPPFEGVVSDYTDANIDGLCRIQRADIDHALVIKEVTLPSARLFQLAFDTINVAQYEDNTHNLYGFAMYYFWIIVVIIGLCNRLVSLIASVRRTEWLPLPSSGSYDSETNSLKTHGGVVPYINNQLQRFIIVPATFGYRCSQNIGWCTIPPRIQSLTISAFIFINIVLCSVSYPTFADNLYWPFVSTQYLRYISDRTGIISFANFPIIWLFGMRNNVVMWLTGWGFGTYNSFHRWVARVATFEAVVHSIGYTVMVLEREGGGWPQFVKYWTKRWWWMGELATIFMVTILVCSVYGLRRSYYEVFLFLHIILSMIVLVTMWYHVEIFGGEYDLYVWPCFAIWIFDRVLRFLRVLSFNPRFWATKSEATYDSDANIVRLVVPYTTSFVKPQPGAYYYIYVLNDFYVWESHPFTLAYYTTGPAEPTSSTPLRSPPRSISPAQKQYSDPESENLLTSSLPGIPAVPSLTFLIRPYTSFTSRLRSSCLLYPSQPRVIVEGPYGSPPPLHNFTRVLFLVGGTGIAVPLSHLSSFQQPDAKFSNRISKMTRVTIVWAVRELAFLTDTMNQDFSILGALENENVEVKAYVTRDMEDVGKLNVDGADVPHNPDVLDEGGHGERVTVHSGRPDVAGEVTDAMNNTGAGILAVVACGPGGLADQARKTVVIELGKGIGRRVEYFEESFKW